MVEALAIDVAPHPLLRASAFTTVFPAPLGEMPVQSTLASFLRIDADAPLTRSEAVRVAVRDLLRHGGYKPTGRGKPASEYLVRAAESGDLGSINVAVDACNAVSLHSGLPISVVDLDRVEPPLRIAVAEEGERYVFNASGQEIELRGLVCLYDAAGPCTNAVKDAQRTKTTDDTTRTLSVVWGVADPAEDDMASRLEGRRGDHEITSASRTARLEAATRWYRALLESTGAATTSAMLRD